MHTFLVLLPTAHLAANACWRFYMQLRLLAAVYILHDRCCLCMAAVVLYVHYKWFVYITATVYVCTVHGRWYSICAWSLIRVHAICCMLVVCAWPLHVGWCLCVTAAVCTWQMLYMHDIWKMCMTTYVCTMYCTWPLLSVHYRWVVSTWLLLPVHDSYCLYMTKAVYYLWPEYWYSEKRIWVICMSSAIMHSASAGQHWQNMAREISLSLLLSPVLQYM